MTDLKPCPFCGGKAQFFVTKKGLSIMCTECYCGTRSATHKHFSMKEWKEVGDTVEYLAKIWNRRAENERQNFF